MSSADLRMVNIVETIIILVVVIGFIWYWVSRLTDKVKERRESEERERRWASERAAEKERMKEPAYRAQKEREKEESRKRMEELQRKEVRERITKRRKPLTHEQVLEKFYENRYPFEKWLMKEYLDGTLLGTTANERKRRALKKKVQELVWDRDGGKCVECGSRENLQFDHIIPHSRGGSDTLENLQILCAKCNLTKGNRSIS